MSAHSSAAASPPEKRTAVTIPALGRMTAEGRKIAMLTAYDATLAAAGASLLVAECVPRELGAALTKAVGIPVIGIGAGPACSGQVLVIYDALGVTTGRPARFVRNFMVGHDGIEAALGAYVVAVKDGSFPAPEHCF